MGITHNSILIVPTSSAITMYQQLYLILTVILAVCEAEKCMHPPPSTQYSNSLYAGRWYEVGKYQTLGGSLFQQGTVCTIATYDPYDSTTGGGVIGYSSRKNEPTGKFVNATGILTQLEHPGHFSQQLNFGGFAGPEVDYNVIWLDETLLLSMIVVSTCLVHLTIVCISCPELQSW